MAKATHSGECQVCGSRQLLPNGRLSKHGYTVRWGFFSGTCTGSDELPFEQSIGLILTAIENAEAAKRDEIKTAAALKALPAADATMGWITLYHKATWDRGNRKGSYKWHEVELTRVETTKDYGTPEKPYLITHVDYTFTNPLTKQADSLDKHGLQPAGHPDLPAVIQTLNTRKAEQVHERRAAQLTQYIAWQQERIANWTPKPLTERKGR